MHVISPDGRTVYVANIGSGTVTPIDTATKTPGEPVEVGVRPRAIVITPDSRTAYVVNQSRPQPPPWHSYEAEDGDCRNRRQTPVAPSTPMDPATNVPGESIDVGNEPFAIAVTPDGRASTSPIHGRKTQAVSPVAKAR